MTYIPLDYLQMDIQFLCSVSNGVVNDKVSLTFVNLIFTVPCGHICSQYWVNLCSFSLKVVTDLSFFFHLNFFYLPTAIFFQNVSVLFAQQVVTFTGKFFCILKFGLNTK